MAMAERDYPVGHPAASDYKGEPYVDRFASYAYDFPEGHPARGGKNRSALDTPDGVRDSHMRQVTPLQDLAMQGSLPPLRDPAKDEPLPLAPAELAHVYATRLASTLEGEPTEAEKQAVGFIKSLGYSMEEAVKLFMNYLQPAKTADQAKG
jgi:hypothetical protein